ncbi:glycoside hydrolase/phage tail family protein [Primorskyibacter flagellatus]|uniref:Putative phage tail protein n=1 Tax=Primorskyibacter flagellatus TaxID=1387277 RepID=A0A1W1Z309_9RHOB|nr:glycoside hydrolase/phage tail family protein [Primorskyibacter flagellatus]SMC42764.1 Putative phage tail protein [Primorskyibacter flagellatus]
MATILLSAAGAALGSSVGGSLLGLSMTTVGRFAGATLGRAIDQRLMGQGSETVETGRIDRFRLTGAGEGAPIAQVYGRMRIGGHLIWATEFQEHVTTSGGGGGGGKGAPRQPKTKSFSYSVSIAMALCEGEITGVHRVWADGAEVPLGDVSMRVYPGSRDQLPDPAIAAVEGAGSVPAYRGTAYVVLEDLALERFGNRIPQFSFEVTRPDQDKDDPASVAHGISGVALMPGTGEYALATVPVHFKYGGGKAAIANINTAAEQPDLLQSLDMLEAELPNARSVSLVVSWFGNDLRCGACSLRPRVEQDEFDAGTMPWRVAGQTRATAGIVPEVEGRPVYGGTPCDTSVVQAIREMNERGQDVMFYPFILMDQQAGNTVPDPWTGAEGQPPLPWRGRITLSAAPGQDGSPDGTAAADAQVAQFFGTASAADFAVGNGKVGYSGPAEWGFRRFILHYAALCAAAGGVSSFCIGSEMRGLTTIRGSSGYPAVAELQTLAAEVRTLLGPDCKIGYAADWSEYFGHHPQDGTGDLRFHLDPLWADDNIDFIGIDNYMPLSDWRDGHDHADAAWESIHNQDYLASNIEGGEGYDWYYPSDEARAAQRRVPITDEAHDEPWVWRYKDIRNWWSNPHHERIAGERQAQPTAWVPGSKPIWFTEYGCAAIDKGSNQPNKFLDPKSSESALPHYSDGRRDELIQHQYLRAMQAYWRDPAHNPVSEIYDGPMIDMDRAFVWAWDARPYPWFPANRALWSDGANYLRGHWLNGRSSGRTLASVVAEICERAGLRDYDVSGLHGFVRGYVVPDVAAARGALQPLMLAYGFDAVERNGLLSFVMRAQSKPLSLDSEALAENAEFEGTVEQTRAADVEMSGRVRVRFLQADGDYDTVAEETVLPDDTTHSVAETELALSMTRAEGRQTAERWLSEARLSRDAVRFALPPSRMDLGAGDVVALNEDGAVYRVDRIEHGNGQLIEAVRVDPDVYLPSEFPDDQVSLRPFAAPVPVLPLFLDLPLLTGDEVVHAPHLALAADPWPGTVAVYDAVSDEDYGLNQIIAARSKVGLTETPLFAAPAGRIDRGGDLQIKLTSGALQSVSDGALLSGANMAAIGDGTPGGWEVFQFRDAELVDKDTWLLSHRLRGQAGTDGTQPAVWPAGSWVVMLDGRPQQIELATATRGLARHYRIGPAKRGYDDPSYVHEVHAFDGIGLRPYRPAHLRLEASDGGVDVSWIRRTRTEGDIWETPEVPIGEEREAYLLRVLNGETVLREHTLETTAWHYSAAARAQDGPDVTVQVAQLSARFGPGPFAKVTITG